MANRYIDRFHPYSVQEVVYDPIEESFSLTEPTIGTYSLDQPNFNVREFLSNLVIRWEFRPGSIVYLVWSQNRQSDVGDGSFNLDRDVRNLVDDKPENIFLVKLSYRFGR